MAIFRHQRPHLAARHREAARASQPGPRSAADAAHSCCSGCCWTVVPAAQPVHLPVAAQLVAARIARHQHRQTALASGEVQLAHMPFVRARQRNAVERGVDVRVHRVLTPHTFKRREATRRNVHALIVQRRGRIDLVFHLLLAGRPRSRSGSAVVVLSSVTLLETASTFDRSGGCRGLCLRCRSSGGSSLCLSIGCGLLRSGRVACSWPRAAAFSASIWSCCAFNASLISRS